MNKLLKILILIFCLTLMGCSSAQIHQKPSELSRLKIVDGTLVNNNNEVFVLRGMSTHGLGWFPRYINTGALKTLQEKGANVIRLAMYSDANQGYLEEAYNLDFVYMGIENAISLDMYVIIDWHILEDNNPLEHKKEAIQFFQEIASHYGNRANIIYEICNEPNGDTSWEDIYQYAQEVIPAIRQYAKDSLIIVGTPEFSTGLNKAMEKPLQFDNLMYAYHKYIDVSQNNIPQYYWLEKAIENKFPVFVSEWGIAYGKDSFQQQLSKEELDDQNQQLNLNPANQFIEFMDKNNISWCGWALSNDKEIHAAILHDCQKLSDWTDNDLTPSGKLMFDHFKIQRDEK